MNLKIIISSLFFLFICNISVNAQDANTLIVGSWKTADFEDALNVLSFTEDGFIIMNLNGEVMDGKDYTVKGGKNDGKKGLIKYEINENVVPITIDIIGYEFETGTPIEVGRMLGIIEFISTDQLRINLNMQGQREKDFNIYNATRTQILYRRKD